MEKETIYIIDTSAILSGKQINLQDKKTITTDSMSKELKPGGRDYQNFLYLKEKGLRIINPTQKSINKIIETIDKTGETDRLSKTDIEILALAYEIKQKNQKNPIVLTDDYSIQNIADILNIKYESISQNGIKKTRNYINRCRGCGKSFKENIKECPICGTETKKVIVKK